MIGSVIRRERERRRLSQVALADLCDYSWITIWRVENGLTKRPTLDLLQRIAKALEIKPETLLNKIRKDGRIA